MCPFVEEGHSNLIKDSSLLKWILCVSLHMVGKKMWRREEDDEEEDD